MYRFAGFELDEQRAELRGPAGTPIKLRPKTFEMLRLFVVSAGRVLSKEELMEALWPNVHVGEDSLFQCIREIRAALGDEQRQMIKLVSGRGYLFVLELSDDPLEPETRHAVPRPPAPALQPIRRGWPPLGRRTTVAVAAGLMAIAGVAAYASTNLLGHPTPTISVLPIVDRSAAATGAAVAAGVTDQLVDGLARIDNLRVVAPGMEAGASSPAEFEVRGELQRSAAAWTLKLRTIRTATGEVEAVTTASVDDGIDLQLQQVRLAAGVGDPLARRLNELAEAEDAGKPASAGGTRVVIEQASASINQTSRERFAAAQKMLEVALAADAGNVDLQVALVSLQTRGIQMLWYDPAAAATAEASGRSLLERALKARPNSVATLEARCRFLSATNSFVESLVACAQAVSLDPWNGSALYQIGLSELFLGRFEDALATFEEAYRYDTPAVSRWTWSLGAAWACLLLDRNEEALEWVERSIAITPASGRSYLLLAAAYQRLGRAAEAKAALAKAMELRPGTTAVNAAPPTRNTSPLYLSHGGRITQTLIEVGLPEE